VTKEGKKPNRMTIKAQESKDEDRATALLDELLKDYKTPEEILGGNGPLGELTRRSVERARQGEMALATATQVKGTILKGAMTRITYCKQTKF
jgi:hypothetical protein